MPLNYLHRCTMSRIEKCLIEYEKTDWNTKDIVLYDSLDNPRLFNCSQTLLGHPQCGGVGGVECLHQRAAMAERHRSREGESGRGREETSRQIAPSARPFRDATDVLRLRFVLPLFPSPISSPLPPPSPCLSHLSDTVPCNHTPPV